jgi:hypothetical protein
LPETPLRIACPAYVKALTCPHGMVASINSKTGLTTPCSYKIKLVIELAIKKIRLSKASTS